MGLIEGANAAKTWEDVAQNLENKPNAETDIPTSQTEVPATE